MQALASPGRGSLYVGTAVFRSCLVCGSGFRSDCDRRMRHSHLNDSHAAVREGSDPAATGERYVPSLGYAAILKIAVHPANPSNAKRSSMQIVSSTAWSTP